MQKQKENAEKYLLAIGGGFGEVGLMKYIEQNLQAKERINELLGLTLENGLTVTLPIVMNESSIRETYNYLFHMLHEILVSGNNYSDLKFKEGTIRNPKGQEVRLGKAVVKYKEEIMRHGYFKLACKSLGITDNKFESLCPRLGELANSIDQELFITSSVVEFMMVNHNSSYSSCYKHQVQGGTSYWTGTLSYGVDPYTLLVGIRRKRDKYKTGRSWLWVFPDGVDDAKSDKGTPFLVQPKSYGEFTTLHREAVREYIQNRIDAKSSWKKITSGVLRETHKYGYIDNYDLHVTWAKGRSAPRDITVNFPSALPCIKCGKQESLKDGSGMCRPCHDNCFSHCKSCGEAIYNEASVYHGPNGEGDYCERCFNRNFAACPDCGDIVARDASSSVRTMDGTNEVIIIVCSSCRENGNYYYCNDCGTWVSASIGVETTVDGTNVCPDCSEGYCDCCGLHFAHESVSHDLEDGRVVCQRCHDAGAVTPATPVAEAPVEEPQEAHEEPVAAVVENLDNIRMAA